MEGQMNERIIATFVYCVELENIVAPHVSFRAPTEAYMRAKTDHHKFLFFEHNDSDLVSPVCTYAERVFGTRLVNRRDGKGHHAVQNNGHVYMRPNRVVAWPNSMHHRFSAVQLEDVTKPGKMRFVQVSLVDPEQRIVSTANVPPQRGDWFGDGLIRGGDDLSKIPPEVIALMMGRGVEIPIETLKKTATLQEEEERREGRMKPYLPNELVDMVKDEVGDEYLMTRGEAEEIRLELMEERREFRELVNDEMDIKI